MMKKLCAVVMALALLACVGCNAPEVPVATEPAAISAAPDNEAQTTTLNQVSDQVADEVDDINAIHYMMSMMADPMSQMTVKKTPVGDCVVLFQLRDGAYAKDLEELKVACRLPVGVRKEMTPPVIKGFSPDKASYVIDVTDEGYGEVITYYPDPSQSEGMSVDTDKTSSEWRKVVTVEIRRIDASSGAVLTRDTIELPEGGAYWCPLEYPGYTLLGDWQGTTALEGTVPRGADDVIVEEIFYTPVEA